jgi:hypothetical protein
MTLILKLNKEVLKDIWGYGVNGNKVWELLISLE